MHSFKLFLRLSPMIRLRKGLTALAYACTLIGIACQLAEPMIFSRIIDDVILAGRHDRLATLLWLAVGFAVLLVLMTTVRTGIFRFLGIQHTLDLRKVLTRHIRKIPLHEIEKNGAGKFSALLGYDTWTMANFLNNVVVEILAQCCMIALAVGTIFYLDWRLGLVALAAVPVLALLPRFFRKPLAHHLGHVRTHNEQIGAHLFECIDGSKEIRAYGLEPWEEARNEEMYRGLVRSSIRESLFRVLSAQASTLPISLLIVVVYWFGSGQVLGGALTVGMLVASVQYLNNALRPIQTINQYFGDLQASEVAMERIERFLQTDIEEAARIEQALGLGQDEVAVAKRDEEPAGDVMIDCRGLRVTVDGAEILHGVDVQVKRGQVVAFVGRSGSGKSTLFKTLMGFLPVSDGEVVLDGVPMNQLPRTALRKKTGIVFQESFLFKGTLMENIRLANWDATDDEVRDAAAKANLEDLIRTLPGGLEGAVEYRGASFSGGQKQRIAIARAILKRPDLLILDEPTSALDRQTETEVMGALRETMQGRTLLIATHRLDTVAKADLIYVMEQGCVAEVGTHDELMKLGGIYHALVLSGSEEEAGA